MWVIEAFMSERHAVAQFSCGNDALDEYIRKYAGQDLRRNLARIFVACAAGAPRVLGYYTVSAASFQKEGLPPNDARRLPRYPVPAAILGRLAVDVASRGAGLGEHLLVDCCRRVLDASRTLAVHALIVDAADERAKTFYVKYGFIPFVNQPSRLFLPTATLERLVAR